MKERKTMIAGVVILVLVPLFIRGIWFRDGSFDPGEIPEIDSSEIIGALLEYDTYKDIPVEGGGIVIFDLSHRNNITINDLTALRDRIVNRGVTLVDFDARTGFDTSILRGASALVIASPTEEYSEREREAILDFANDGGRVLLIADPTRTAELDVGNDIFAALFPESAVPAINSLAGEFGIVYVDDYLYNLRNNEGSYRNVILKIFSDEHPLSEGLDSLIVFAAHSLRSDGIPIAKGDRNTLSPVRSGETGLSPIMLSEDGQALALGDLTFLTPPFHTMADNDRFLSNIADWLATAERDWDVTDFPYVFQQDVDLIPIGDKPLDDGILLQMNSLENVIKKAGLSITLGTQISEGHDALRVGTYSDWSDVASYLAAAEVQIFEGEDGEEISVDSLGRFYTDGTILYITAGDEDRVILIALANNDDAVLESLAILRSGDFSDCASSGIVTVCAVASDGISDFGDDDEDEEISSLCPGVPASVAIGRGFPRLASPEETECVFDMGLTFSLQFFSDAYLQEKPFEPGDVYVYPITFFESTDAFWSWGWCTTPEQFEENWENITLTFTLNGVEIPLSDFYVREQHDDDLSCRTYYTVVTDWPEGEHLLITTIVFETDLDDGFEDGQYEAGPRTYRYEVSVEG